MAFCRWMNERLHGKGLRLQVGKGGKLETLELSIEKWELRLPKEAEWEKAARGTDGRIFLWGDKPPDPNIANYGETNIGSTSAVGSFPAGASPYGALDMSGNVWEWCQTKWRDSYDKPADESLEGTEPWVVRGGAWDDGQGNVRCAARGGYGPGNWNGDLGFRVVVSPGSP